MKYTIAERRIGKWCAHNNEFWLAESSVGCDGRCRLILKLLKRTQQLGIGFYVYQDKVAMRARLQRELIEWNPVGLKIAFCGLINHDGDEGFALYAYIDGVAPRNLEDGAIHLNSDLDIVCKRIRTVAEKLKGFANLEFQ